MSPCCCSSVWTPTSHVSSLSPPTTPHPPSAVDVHRIRSSRQQVEMTSSALQHTAALGLNKDMSACCELSRLCRPLSSLCLPPHPPNMSTRGGGGSTLTYHEQTAAPSLQQVLCSQPHVDSLCVCVRGQGGHDLSILSAQQWSDLPQFVLSSTSSLSTHMFRCRRPAGGRM